MSNDSNFTSYRVPMLVPPMSLADQLTAELENARRKTGFISSFVHQYREANATEALKSTTIKHEAVNAAIKSATEVLNSRSDYEVAVVRCRVHAELAPLMHQVAREEAMIELQTRLSKAEESNLIAQREAVSARNSLEATREFKQLNFAVGAARKKATIAETMDAIPREEPASSSSARQVELGDALRHRADLRANGVDVPDWLNTLIDQLRGSDDIASAAE